MLKKDAVRFYGTEAKLAKALKIHRSAVLRWSDRVPMLRAAQLDVLTAGRLKYDQDAYLITCIPKSAPRRSQRPTAHELGK